MKKLHLLILFFSFSISVFAQMRIIDPQNQWWQSEASIENVHMEIRPAGIFCETAITFDVKTSENPFPNDIQLEYIYDFSMREDIVFNDSWLWIEDYISKGEIYEQSEGTAIYEAIVDRRQDPSILTKKSDGEYNFRIYPLFSDSSRRVRLSYLVPFDNQDKTLLSTLPFDFLRDSHEKPQNVTLDITDDINWFHLSLDTDQWTTIGSQDNVTSYSLTTETLAIDQEIAFASDTQEEYALGVYEEDETKYFQLMYNPQIELDATPTYNLILLDHESDNTNIDRNAVLSILSNELNDLTAEDRFNILYHDFTPQYTSDSWQVADPTQISQAINKISLATQSTFSWLGTLLPEALTYAEEMGQKTRIIVISADNNFFNANSSSDFLSNINSYITQMSSEVSLSIIDYSKHRPGDWIEGQYYRGNEYLYTRLSQRHNGIFNIVTNQTQMKAALDISLLSDIAYIEEYDLDIENEFGFSYSKYFTGPHQKIRLDKPIKLTGKYIGEVPFTLEFDAIYDGQIIQRNLSLTPNIILDKKAVDSWTSQYILSNENSSDPNIINNVIDASFDEQLLSKHTIFLCLERDTSAISSNNAIDDDEGIVTVATEDIDKRELIVRAFPSPFTDHINIEIPSGLAASGEDLRVEILTSEGKSVTTMDQKFVAQNGKINIVWTPEQSLTGGIYLIKVITESDVETLKVMLVR